ncbi:MAG: type II secretion system F family protein [Candidatus Aminicenantes bacterium]|nr:type II secretion system F family protein [Candidatus Aminicenantes bacterium]
MATYSWKGRSRTGRLQEGMMVAGSKSQAIINLRRQQIMVVSIKEKGREIALPKLRGGVKQKELAVFARQLAFMIDAGLPLNQALEILGMQQDNKAFQKVLFHVRQDVESGLSLTDALRNHPRVFSELFCNMVAAGESGGIMDTILQRLSVHLEKAIKLKRAIKSAMIYPSVVISVAILVLIIILWKVIPVFGALFSSLGAQLPLPTRILIQASNFLGNYIIFIIIALALLAITLRYYHGTYNGRRVIDRIMLKIPVMGMLIKKIGIARFCRTLGTLISSGVPILDSMEITAKTAGNSILEDAILRSRKSIEQGKTIAEPLKETELFPPMVTQMIAVGEHTGELDNMVTKVADFYEEEVDNSVANLLSLLEPAMVLFLGVTIGSIVVSLYMPIFSLLGKIT